MNTKSKLGLAGVGLAGVIAVGALTAAALPAQAESATSTPSTWTTAPDPSQGGHTANGITEELLTGDVAAKVQAAVEAAYPGATIDRMENDAEGATYEAHIVQADGTSSTVKLDASFAITGTEAGHGGGLDDADGNDGAADTDTETNDDSATSGSSTS